MRRCACSDARGDRAAAKDDRRHHALCHARSGRGDDDGRPRRGDGSGRLQQFAAPRDALPAPANLFVANFIGSPAINLLEGKIVSDSSGLALAIGSERFSLPPALIDRAPAVGDYAERSVVVGVRPESLAISAIADPPGGALRGAVAFVEDLGASLLLHLDVDAPRPRLADTEDEGVAWLCPASMRGCERWSAASEIPGWRSRCGLARPGADPICSIRAAGSRSGRAGAEAGALGLRVHVWSASFSIAKNQNFC